MGEGKHDIPAQFNPHREGAAVPPFSDDFDDAVGATARKLQAHIREMLFLRMGDLTVGDIIADTKPAESKLKEHERRRGEDDIAFARRMLKEQVNAYIADLNDQIARIEEHLAAIRKRLEATDELDRLYAEGLLDPSNPEHRALLERVGIGVDEFKADPSGAVDRARGYWTAEEAEWNDRLREMKDRRAEAEDLNHRVDVAQTEDDLNSIRQDFAAMPWGGEEPRHPAAPATGAGEMKSLNPIGPSKWDGGELQGDFSVARDGTASPESAGQAERVPDLSPSGVPRP